MTDTSSPSETIPVDNADLVWSKRNHARPCRRCDGDGYVEVFDDEIMQIVATHDCPTCGGTGTVGDV